MNSQGYAWGVYREKQVDRRHNTTRELIEMLEIETKLREEKGQNPDVSELDPAWKCIFDQKTRQSKDSKFHVGQ